MNDEVFEMNGIELEQSIESLKHYNQKIRVDIDSLKQILDNMEQVWQSKGEDIESITKEVKIQIIKLLNIESSILQLVDALTSLQE